MFSKISAVLCLATLSALSVDANLRGSEEVFPEAHRRLERKCVGGMWVDDTPAPTNAPRIVRTSSRVGLAPAGRGSIQRTSSSVGPAPSGARPRTALTRAPAGRGSIQRTSSSVGPSTGRGTIQRTSSRVGPAPTTSRAGRGGRRLEEAECVDDDIITASFRGSGTKGDPHFKTQGGEMYDFHGGCDLVLMDDPKFFNDLGLLVHIRTKISTWWSYVESSVVRIGTDTVEISGGNGDDWLYINGVANAPLEDEDWHKIEFDNAFIRFKKTGDNHEVKIYIGGAQEVVGMKTYKDFVMVEIREGVNHDGSLGLLGNFPAGERVGRDSVAIEDINEFGQHWQIKPDEPKLFHTYDADWIVSADQMCAMPTETAEKRQLRNRRLAESGLTMDMIEEACDHLEYIDAFDACVADVVATQDIEMASGGVW